MPKAALSSRSAAAVLQRDAPDTAPLRPYASGAGVVRPRVARSAAMSVPAAWPSDCRTDGCLLRGLTENERWLNIPLSPLLSRYDHVLLDLDGCVWVQDTCTPGAVEALGALRAAGKAIAFVTNDARRSPEEFVRKLWSLGLQASLEEIVTVGSAIQAALAERPVGTSAMVIGAAPIFRHVSDGGAQIVNGTDRATRAEVVVVAGHDDFDFAELRTATQAVLAGATMIAAGRDRTFPTADGQWPGTGAIVAALEYATGRTARSVGKPDRMIFETALDRLGPGRALMVGDRLDSDLAGAAAAGIDGAIVLTGIATREQAQAASAPVPVAVAENLHALVTR